MSSSSQIGWSKGAALARPLAGGTRRAASRRLPVGIGLAAGAVASLALWAGLIHVVVSLVG